MKRIVALSKEEAKFVSGGYENIWLEPPAIQAYVTLYVARMVVKAAQRHESISYKATLYYAVAFIVLQEVCDGVAKVVRYCLNDDE